MSKVSVQFAVCQYDALQAHTIKLIFNENPDLYDKESLMCSGMKDHKLFNQSHLLTLLVLLLCLGIKDYKLFNPFSLLQFSPEFTTQPVLHCLQIFVLELHNIRVLQIVALFIVWDD